MSLALGALRLAAARCLLIPGNSFVEFVIGVDDGRREGKQCRRAYYFSKMHILDFLQTAGEDWDYLLHLHVDSLKKFFIVRKRDFCVYISYSSFLSL